MGKKYNPWKRGEPALIEVHSLKKHEVFQRYLSEYIQIVGRGHHAQKKLKVTLVDGFAGGGLYTDDQNNLYDGSPLILLKTAKEAEFLLSQKQEFKLDAQYIFVEKNQKIFSYLKSNLEKRGCTNRFNKDVYLFRGSFEAHLDQIIKMAKTHNRTGRSIFLLDQYGYTDVTLFALQKIFSKLKNAEVLLTFSVDFLTTFASGNDIFQKTLKNVGFRFDTENLLEEKKHRNWRHEIQHKLIADLKNKAGARFYTNFFIKSEKSHMSYWLVHLSSHHRARDVMQEIHWNLRNAFAHEGKPGLFMLGYHPEKDYDLTNQTFLFSESDRELSHNALLDDIPRLLPTHRMQVDQFLMSQINETPATLKMMKDALKELHLYDEIVIKTPTGRKKKKKAKLKKGDIIERNRQLIIPSLGR